MKRSIHLILLLFLFSNYSSAQNEDPRFVDGKLYVRLKTADTTFSLSNPLLSPLVGLYHLDTCYRPFAGLGNDTLDRTYCLKFGDTPKTMLCMDTLRSLPVIEFVEQVPIYHTSYVPNDIQPSQYGLIKINAESAWNISKGSPSVVIAIVDNAILNTHQDLAANMVAGYDVADNDDNPAPPAGFSGVYWNHGTHTSGIASAVTDNGIGIASIGFNSKIMPVKCTSDTSVSGEDIYYADEGITYAIRNGAKVISMSFGSYQSSITEQILINTGINQGIVMVAAAGNDDSSAELYPASYDGVISVGATDQNDVKASFSNYGSRIDVMAPGVSVYSTFATNNSAYGTLSGTSMSCPLVAGLAALVLAQNPTYTTAQVVSAIKSTADNIATENPNLNGDLGTGRINAYHALGGVGSGVESINEMKGVRAYPNPFSGKIIVEINNEQPTTVQVSDIEGRVLINHDFLQKNDAEIETSALPEGIYIVKVITDSGTVSSKMVKM